MGSIVSGPLIPLVDDASATPEQAAILAKAPPRAVTRLLAHAPGAHEGVFGLGRATMDPEAIGIPPALREAVAIRVGRLRGSEYVEKQHRRVGEMVGLSASQVEAAAMGSESAGLDPLTRAALRIAEAAHFGHPAGREDIEALAIDHGYHGVIGVLVVAGFFGLMAGLTTSLALPVDLPKA